MIKRGQTLEFIRQNKRIIAKLYKREKSILNVHRILIQNYQFSSKYETFVINFRKIFTIKDREEMLSETMGGYKSKDETMERYKCKGELTKSGKQYIKSIY